MKKKWVVVAESSRARIFDVVSRTEPMKEIDDLVNVASREHDRDLTSDVPGRAFDTNGLGGRHSMEPHTDPKKQEIAQFAQFVGDRIEKARRVGDCNELVLISSPEFLGLLRQKLDGETQKHISKTINKNLIQKSEAEIRAYMYQ